MWLNPTQVMSLKVVFSESISVGQIVLILYMFVFMSLLDDHIWFSPLFAASHRNFDPMRCVKKKKTLVWTLTKSRRTQRCWNKHLIPRALPRVQGIWTLRCCIYRSHACVSSSCSSTSASLCAWLHCALEELFPRCCFTSSRLRPRAHTRSVSRLHSRIKSDIVRAC